MAEKRYERFYAIVRQIPAGSVATYGQVALLADLPGRARQVGYALFRVAPEEAADIPWHRVVNARGEISQSPARNGSDRRQKELLLAEGITFDAGNRINLKQYRWQVGLTSLDL
ncbi:MAG: MGMT family protein [Cyanobacteria bacterium J06641_5]